MQQHKTAVIKEDSKKSALAEHKEKTGHASYSFKQVETLVRETNWRRRNFKEAFMISKEKNPLNRHWEMGNLPSIYKAITIG